MSKTFKLVETVPFTSAVINWKLCILCQQEKGESLICPSKSKRKDVGSGYRSLTESMIKFNELGQLPFTLERLDEGCGVETAMVSNSAQYHKSCRLKYNSTKYERAQKRVLKADSDHAPVLAGCKRSRRSQDGVQNNACFFCGEPPGDSGIHEAATHQIYKRVHTCAVLLEDTALLAKLSAGDMVAQDAKYHSKCLASLYNRARSVKSRGEVTDKTDEFSGIAFAELVIYIEEVRQADELGAPVFKLSDLAQLYSSRMEQLGVKLETRVHTTRLKDRLLAQFHDMRAQKKGRDILLAFEDVGAALATMCELDSDNDAIHLARATKIVRSQLFEEANSFSGFSVGCQEKSVPSHLLALVTKILEGPSIKDQSEERTPAALSIAQLLKFNSTRQKRDSASSAHVRHSTIQETPVPR